MNEECPICLEKIHVAYKMTSCSHTICMKCCRKMKKDKSTIYYPFDVDTVKVHRLTCPLCRTLESIVLDPKKYAVEKIQQMEIALNMTYFGTSEYTIPPTCYDQIIYSPKHYVVRAKQRGHKQYKFKI